jgi:hypothetical protein
MICEPGDFNINKVRMLTPELVQFATCNLSCVRVVCVDLWQADITVVIGYEAPTLELEPVKIVLQKWKCKHSSSSMYASILSQGRFVCLKKEEKAVYQKLCCGTWLQITLLKLQASNVPICPTVQVMSNSNETRKCNVIQPWGIQLDWCQKKAQTSETQIVLFDFLAALSKTFYQELTSRPCSEYHRKNHSTL